MEKNKSVLIASISGIVACLVCIGMVYLFTPKGSNNLKNNEGIVNQEEEILLGDTCSSYSYSEWSPGAWSLYSCGTPYGSTAEPTSSTSGVSYTQVEVGTQSNCNTNTTTCSTACIRSRTWTRTMTCEKCSA